MRRTDRRTARARSFAVLTVCTGNICRSPLAEQLLRLRLHEAGMPDVEVASAGLGAVVGAPMHPISAEISRRLGADPSSARGQQITGEIASAADLVLTMTRGQRDELVRKFPRVAQRSFTLVEFARLMSTARADEAQHAMNAPSNALIGLVAGAAKRRGTIRLGEADDVIDPIDHERDVHEAVGEQIALASSRIVFGMKAST